MKALTWFLRILNTLVVALAIDIVFVHYFEIDSSYMKYVVSYWFLSVSLSILFLCGFNFLLLLYFTVSEEERKKGKSPITKFSSFWVGYGFVLSLISIVIADDGLYLLLNIFSYAFLGIFYALVFIIKEEFKNKTT